MADDLQGYVAAAPAEDGAGAVAPAAGGCAAGLLAAAPGAPLRPRRQLPPTFDTLGLLGGGLHDITLFLQNRYGNPDPCVI